jgi:predicted permease
MAVDAIWRDLRYAIRLLRSQPGYTSVAIATLAIGIGATTMLFSVAYGVLLKPLPWPDADRLVRVTETRQGRTGRVVGTVSNSTFLAWRERASTIEDIGGWMTRTMTLTEAGDPVRVTVNPVTASLFAVLRARPLMGRLLREGEGARGQPGLAILSYGLWQERFGARPDVLGRVVQLDGTPYTVVGVMPRDFMFPDRDTRAWIAWSVPPLVSESGALSGTIFRAIARLRNGATEAQAAAEATARARGGPDMGVVARALFGAVGPIDVFATREIDAVTADVRPAVLVLLAGVALLLVTATANVASLQLARATTRRRELAVRAAIGAGSRHLARQLLVENGVVGLCGGAAGLVIAAVLLRVLPSLLPGGFPRLEDVATSTPVFVFAVALSTGTSVGCGLVPVWHVRRVNVVEALSEDGVAPVGGTWRSPAARTRGVIMAGEVAIACVLLIAASLLTRSFIALIRTDRGYDPVNVMTARVPFPPDYSLERRRQLLDSFVERLRAVPGVTHVAYSTALPFASSGGFTAFTMPSPQSPDIEVHVQAAQRVVSPDYFAAMRLRLVAGRALAETDTERTSPVVVVNRSFARQYLGDHPVGVHVPKRGATAGFHFTNEQAGFDVVGVVDDMRQDSVDAPLEPEIFVSFRQMVPTVLRNFEPFLVVRTTSDPTTYTTTVRNLVHEQAPTVAVDSVMTMEDRVRASLARPRLYAVILAWFGVLAVLIAGIGLFGILSFSVAQRTREIGVRSALGAQAHDIVALVLRQGLWMVAAGVSVGLAASVMSVRLLSGFLYGVAAFDKLTFVLVPFVIVAVAVAACVVPARRAASVDPLAALRAS